MELYSYQNYWQVDKISYDFSSLDKKYLEKMNYDYKTRIKRLYEAMSLNQIYLQKFPINTILMIP